MKASELRIGNWVTVMGSLPQQVTGYHIFMMETYRPKDKDEASYEDMTQPIPLTEEWLRKFGFEDNSYAMFYKYVDNEFFITVSFKDYTHTQLSEHPVEVNDYSLPLDCKYVHQLQNLFHALTGEELTIAEQ